MLLMNYVLRNIKSGGYSHQREARLNSLFNVCSLFTSEDIEGIMSLVDAYFPFLLTHVVSSRSFLIFKQHFINLRNYF